MDKRTIIELIKLFDYIKFTERLEGEDTIGYIQDHDRTIQVSFLEDNIGKYLKLSFTIENIDKSEEMLSELSSRIVNGRWYLLHNSIILYTIIPIINETFLKEQFEHGLSEIWDMSNIINHFKS